ncbi:MAG TPA: hypothetical protein VNT03_15145 [Baekduia sp.]|nr:hypothetical protein [Baekduia sp.]
MRVARSFAAFLYDFVVGDDALLFALVAAAVIVTAMLGAAGADVWWLLPAAVALGLAGSVVRAVAGGRRR